jgi:ELWxxDGT repeat protein
MQRLPHHLVPFLLATTLLPAQAVLLRDIRVGTQGAGTFGYAELQGRQFFNGDTATGGDLFATDGTVAGTVAFNLPAAGARYYGAVPLAVGPLLYFIGRTTAHGAELWISDGTLARTRRLTDLNPGSTDSGVNT